MAFECSLASASQTIDRVRTVFYRPVNPEMIAFRDSDLVVAKFVESAHDSGQAGQVAVIL